MATPSMFNRSYAELPIAGVNTRVMDSRGSLANRAATPVGRSTMDPARIAGMISRGTASKNKIAGATFMQNLQDSMIGRQLNERQMRLREQSVAEERRRYDLEQKQKQDELAKREQFRKAQLDVMRGTMTPPSGVQTPPTSPSAGLSGLPMTIASPESQRGQMVTPTQPTKQPSQQQTEADFASALRAQANLPTASNTEGESFSNYPQALTSVPSGVQPTTTPGKRSPATLKPPTLGEAALMAFPFLNPPLAAGAYNRALYRNF